MTAADFIEVYEGALDRASCRALVERFEASRQAQRGATGSGVDVSLKDSWDIQLDAHPAWNDAKQQLNAAAFDGLKRYLRRYAHAALAPLQLKMPDPQSGEPVALDADRLATLDDPSLAGLAMKIFRPGSINLQKYLAGHGGYPYWHSEQYPKLDHGEALHRVLVAGHLERTSDPTDAAVLVRLGHLAEIVPGPRAQALVAHARAIAARDDELVAVAARDVSTCGLWLPSVRPSARLTAREREIAGLAAVGFSSRAIADRLTLSVRTVDSHLSRVFTKLNVRGRQELGSIRDM